MPRPHSSKPSPPNQILLKNGQSWTEMQVRDFFAGIRSAMKVDDPFPINFEDIWPLAYANRGNGKRSMDRLKFVEGIHKKTSLLQPEKRCGDPGYGAEKIMLSVAAAEHMIIEKIPRVREVYRKVFHEWFDSKETKERLERDAVRAEGKEIRKSTCAIYAAHGVTHKGYPLITNKTYQGVLGKDTAQLREHYEITDGSSPREKMSKVRLSAIGSAESLTGQVVEDQNIRGNHPIADVAYDVGIEVRQAFTRILNKPRRTL